MKRISATCSALLASLILSQPVFAQQRMSAAMTAPVANEVDRIVAVVNDEPITSVELNSRLSSAVAQLRAQQKTQGGEMPPMDVLQKQMLERLVMERAQLQLARDNGLQVDENALDAAMARIAENNRMSMAQFRQTIEKEGLSWTRFREEIRSEILLTRLREREVDARIAVSDGEIDNFLNEQATQTTQEVNLQHILIRVPESATPEALNKLKQKAQATLDRIRKGEDFSKIAASVSEAPEALQGGEVGWRPLDRLPPLFADALAKLQPGQTSEVLRSSAGFHILRLNDRRTTGALMTKPVEQTHARHILIRTSPAVTDTDAQQRLLGIKERVEHGTDFAELAKINSADLTASKGGDLGWLYPGDTVPEFEIAMNQLKPGQVSNPVQSPFGWHLIQVLDRRIEDVSSERKRLMARQALRERKSDEAYQDWLRQLRDRTYVEYHLDDGR